MNNVYLKDNLMVQATGFLMLLFMCPWTNCIDMIKLKGTQIIVMALNM